jgi:hypothetical protein
VRILVRAVVVIAGVISIALLLVSYRDDVVRRRQVRQQLFEELQPVALQNCDLERFGEANDGGYLMCANLLGLVAAGYSYGINGYDGWGCEISRRLSVRVHQYDCFDPRRTTCPGGDQMFHGECIGASARIDNGRAFATLADQIGRNGDTGKHLVVKMDVEGSEWESLDAAAPSVLDAIDQLAIEFHGNDEEQFVRVVRKLKEQFYVAHLHFNNFSCQSEQPPFPAEAYEVLFVNKSIGRLDPSRRVVLPHRVDAPNNPDAPDCQAGKPTL